MTPLDLEMLILWALTFFGLGIIAGVVGAWAVLLPWKPWAKRP